MVPAPDNLAFRTIPECSQELFSWQRENPETGVALVEMGRVKIWRQKSSYREHRRDREGLIRALVEGRSDEQLRELRVEREVRHLVAHLCEVPLVVQGAQVVEQLQRPHQRLRRLPSNDTGQDSAQERAGQRSKNATRI